MYGPYAEAMAAAAALAKKIDLPSNEPRWFSCLNCQVMWKEANPKSHCFTCGKWGKRGRMVQWP